MKKSSEIIIRTASFKDKESILTLLNEVFSDQQRSLLLRDSNYYNWKFLSTPFGKPILTLAVENDRIIGVANLWPWEFTLRGQVLKAMQPCDSVVHPSARGKGLFKKMRLQSINLVKEEGVSFFFNFPNNQSLSANRSIGWNYLGKINWWIKILSPIKVAKEYFRKEKSENISLSNNLKVDAVILDKLAEESRVFDHYLRIHRVKGFHSYRYIEHPNRDYGMVFYDCGSKSSAAVFTINQKGASREMVIVDLIGSSKHSDSLINLVIKEAKILNVDLVAVLADTPFFQQSLWLKGFIKIKEKNMVVLPLDIGMENLAKDFKLWNMVAGLHDSI